MVSASNISKYHDIQKALVLALTVSELRKADFVIVVEGAPVDILDRNL